MEELAQIAASQWDCLFRLKKASEMRQETSVTIFSKQQTDCARTLLFKCRSPAAHHPYKNFSSLNLPTSRDVDHEKHGASDSPREGRASTTSSSQSNRQANAIQERSHKAGSRPIHRLNGPSSAYDAPASPRHTVAFSRSPLLLHNSTLAATTKHSSHRNPSDHAPSLTIPANGADFGCSAHADSGGDGDSTKGKDTNSENESPQQTELTEETLRAIVKLQTLFRGRVARYAFRKKGSSLTQMNRAHCDSTQD